MGGQLKGSDEEHEDSSLWAAMLAGRGGPVRVLAKTVAKLLAVVIVCSSLTFVVLLALDTAALGDWYLQPVGTSYSTPFSDIVVSSEDEVNIAYADTSSYSSVITRSQLNHSIWEQTSLGVMHASEVRMVLDHRGFIHICASTTEGVANQSLLYATNMTGSWTVETLPVISRHPHIATCAIAVDSNSRVYIIYNLGDEVFTLRYITNRDGSWTDKELVPVVPDSYESYVGVQSAVCDSVDVLHIVYGGYVYYHNESTGVSGSYAIMKYGQISGGLLTSIDFPSEYLSATSVSMAIDIGEVAHFAFYNRVNGDNYTIVHATYDGSVWSGDEVADAGLCFWWPDDTAIAVDQGGRVHISYYSGGWAWRDGGLNPTGNRSICYVSNATGAWSGEVIDAVGSQNALRARTSIAVDSESNVHISYYKRFDDFHYTESIMYATNSREPQLTSSAMSGIYLGSSLVALVAASAYTSQHYFRLRRQGYRLEDSVYSGLQVLFWVIAFPAQLVVIGWLLSLRFEVAAAVTTAMVFAVAELVGYHYYQNSWSKREKRDGFEHNEPSLGDDLRNSP